VNDAEVLKSLILRICSIKPFKSSELAVVLGKREDYLKRKFPGELITTRELKYLHPEMLNHPEQAYLTNNRD
jgi:ATP-dependent DNA helicase RecG